MIQFRNLAAGLVLLAGATPALAAVGPRLLGGGENAQVVYADTDRGNVVGGGRIAVANDPGRGFVVTYFDLPPASGIGAARLVGGGENTTVIYGPPAPSATAGMLAQRR